MKSLYIYTILRHTSYMPFVYDVRYCNWNSVLKTGPHPASVSSLVKN